MRQIVSLRSIYFKKLNKFVRIDYIKIGLIILNIILILVSAHTLTKFYSYSENTFYDNGNWASTKMNLKRGVVGAKAFMVTKVALAKNRLNLSFKSPRVIYARAHAN